ncbi:MAG: tetratricopeptide repeat protein [Candidatus Saganbacteria bacterium]|nr:tetratricopeptide repeat protein [Candidatus Saganbacteria bacterium]
MSDYTVTFKPQSNIWKLYQKLKKSGVKDHDLDRGYPRTDYVKKKRYIIKRGDRKIQKQEVLNYALENHEKYQRAIKETTGYVVPWSLDDLDPKTTFDSRIRAKVDKTIAIFKVEIKKAGYKDGTDKYKELLAVSLFAYVMVSKKHSLLQNIAIPNHIKNELRGAGLEAIVWYLMRFGGLGRKGIKNDCELEATALEALKKRCGLCSETSSIVYAAFKRAKLRVGFLYGVFSQAGRKKMNPEPQAGMHLSIKLFINKKIRYFESTIEYDASKYKLETIYKGVFDLWFQVSNREFLAMYYLSLAVEYSKKGELDLAIAAFKRGINIYPNFAAVYYDLGIYYVNKGRLDLAYPAFLRVIKINPNYAKAFYQLGKTYAAIALILEKAGNKVKALKVNQKALVLIKKAKKLGESGLELLLSTLQDRIKALEKELGSKTKVNKSFSKSENPLQGLVSGFKDYLKYVQKAPTCKKSLNPNCGKQQYFYEVGNQQIKEQDKQEMPLWRFF